MISVQDRIAAVTGAGRGIGRAVSRALRDAGVRLILLDRDEGALASAAAELGPVTSVVADCGNPEAAAAALHAAAGATGGLDILINNAGRFSISSSGEVALEDWEETLRVNLTAPYFLAVAAAWHMRARGGGVIINVSSVAAYYPRPDQAAYCASKAGLEHLTRVLALDLAPDNIRVNTLRPGLTNSDMGRGAIGRTRDGHIEGIPLGQMARPEAIAEGAIFLATAEHMTGQVLCIDGGQTISFARPRLADAEGPVPGEN